MKTSLVSPGQKARRVHLSGKSFGFLVVPNWSQALFLGVGLSSISSSVQIYFYLKINVLTFLKILHIYYKRDKIRWMEILRETETFMTKVNIQSPKRQKPSINQTGTHLQTWMHTFLLFSTRNPTWCIHMQPPTPSPPNGIMLYYYLYTRINSWSIVVPFGLSIYDYALTQQNDGPTSLCGSHINPNHIMPCHV